MAAMTTTDRLSGVPSAELATLPDPASWHERLRSLGTHARGGQWTVSTLPDVAAALSTPALQAIRPSAGTGQSVAGPGIRVAHDG
jgi:hypothetical protein